MHPSTLRAGLAAALLAGILSSAVAAAAADNPPGARDPVLPHRRQGVTASVTKAPPMRYPQTQAMLAEIRRRLGMPLVVYWNSHSGSVCHSDVNALYEILRARPPQEKMALFIKSGGGEVEASLRIVNLLRRYAERLVALVPLECASAATMVAIGADEIHMGPLAHLTAVDTSLTHPLSPLDPENAPVAVSQNELARIVRLWREAAGEDRSNPYQALFQYVHPLVIGAINRSESLSIRICEEILGGHLKDPDRVRRISTQLNGAYPSHDYPITLDEARRIGLPARDLDPAVNDRLLALNKLYSEMGQQARTDFDQNHYHTNEILNIVEGEGVQVFFQEDVEWHYIGEERRWRSTNDNGGWRMIRHGRPDEAEPLHIN